ncbi:ImmA/IrrE family metallo-endopeptidase [Streptococcus agalactiae]|nr:ImmA/IrrE family metallo-endopeptidase [Streptococcus agalactiae]RRA94740.1 ImmA/IrrE family metallo-endopeptidase [Streptococcus agalactiae]
MKNTGESLIDYHFSSYLNYYLKRYNIKILEHHFSCRKIEGLTLINEDGVSFSYEKDNSTEKQNFTMCHELGHFVLGHSGKCFTELRGKSDSVKEREANIFSATVLMPDIVLLAKIFYRQDSFQRVKADLVVSCEALIYRLVNLFVNLLLDSRDKVYQVVYHYYHGNNQYILDYFRIAKEKIIKEYQEVSGDVFIRIKQKLLVCGFVASDQIPELLDDKFRKELEINLPNVKTWIEYNFGKTIGYAWLTNQMTKQEARNRAKRIILLSD